MVSFGDIDVSEHHVWFALENSYSVIMPTLSGSNSEGSSWLDHCFAEWTFATAIDFLDEQLGWATIGAWERQEGVVVRTTDGGRTWLRAATTSRRAILRDVTFVDRDHGWAVGDQQLEAGGQSGLASRTSDGGRTWTDMLVPGTSSLSEVHFVDQRVGWALDSDGKVASTVDGGASWSVVAVGLLHIQAAFGNATEGWLAGTSTEPGVVLATVDGGRTWSRVGELPEEPVSVQLVGPGRLRVMVGGPPVAYDSTDGGRTWTALPSTLPRNVNRVRWYDARLGWAAPAGIPGCAYETRDGGATWQAHRLFNAPDCVPQP
jgi:photosystem II stability/assembly factor-like uncharacterized protein